MICQYCGSKDVSTVDTWCETTITCRDCKKVTVEEMDFSVEELFGNMDDLFEDADLMDIVESNKIKPEQIKEVFKIIDENLLVENIDTMVDGIVKMMENNSDKK